MSAERSHVLADPVARARMMLQAAEWAASAFARYDRVAVARIVDAVAEAGFAHAGEYAQLAVRETGFGVVEHKQTKNEIASRGIAEHYREHDFVTPQVREDRKIVSLPRPAGVIFALTPSTNPVSTLYFKLVLALMTRNAIVVSPHPLAVGCTVAAARTLAEAAAAAGAPRDVIQVIDEPSIPLIEALMADRYRSGNPAIGVGPGNAPVAVDATADLRTAARQLVDSKAFDNSLLCSSESVLVAEAAVADPLIAALRGAGAYVCTAAERDRLRAFLFPDGRLNTDAVGHDAAWVARSVGLRVAPKTPVLLAPIELVIQEEPLAHEKMCPVLGFHVQPDIGAVVKASRAVLRIAGAGHSAAIHSTEPAHVMAFASAVNVLRVVVNAPNSTGVAGFDTHLAPTMTVGTGFTGGSSVGENLGPQHLVNWCEVAYGKRADIPFPDYATLRPWEATPAGSPPPIPPGLAGDASAELREQIRRLVLEELRELVEA
jgi:acetaldehyde dehydrogenase/alcohol dehydrogenase